MILNKLFKKPVAPVVQDDGETLEQMRARIREEARQREERTERFRKRAEELGIPERPPKPHIETSDEACARLHAQGQKLHRELEEMFAETDREVASTQALLKRVLALELPEIDQSLAATADQYIEELEKDDEQEVRDEEAWNRESQSSRRR